MRVLAQRMLQEMSGERPALLDEACRQLLAAQLDQPPAEASEAAADGDEVLALVRCSCVDTAGRAQASQPDGVRLGRRAHTRVVAVLDAIHGSTLLQALSSDGEAASGEASAGEASAGEGPHGHAAAGAIANGETTDTETIVVARVLTPVAVLDVAPEGLVIVELLEGVSATDIQARVKPTLKISPRVKQLLAKAPAASNDGG